MTQVLEVGGGDVTTDAVHRNVIGVGPLPVDAELSGAAPVRCDRNRDHARCQVDQRLDAPPVERQVADELPVNGGGNRR